MKEDPYESVKSANPNIQKHILDSICVEKVDEFKRVNILEQNSLEDPSNYDYSITTDPEEMTTVTLQYYRNRLSKSHSNPAKYRLWAYSSCGHSPEVESFDKVEDVEETDLNGTHIDREGLFFIFNYSYISFYRLDLYRSTD